MILCFDEIYAHTMNFKLSIADLFCMLSILMFRANRQRVEMSHILSYVVFFVFFFFFVNFHFYVS